MTPSTTQHNSSRDTTDSVSPSPRKVSNPSSSGYVYESDTVRRAAPVAPPPPPASMVSSTPIKQSTGPSVRPREEIIPYHAREDSKPFTYGLVLNGSSHKDQNGSTGPTSPSIHRRNWKESSNPNLNGNGLESPSLVRKFSTGSVEPPMPTSPTPRSVPRIPPPSLSSPAQPTSPRPLRKLSESISSPVSQPVATSSPRLDSGRQRSISVTEQRSKTLEESIQDISTSPDSSSIRSVLRFFSCFFLPIFSPFRPYF